MSEQPARRLDVIQQVGASWCRLMHARAMWPIHGAYQCRVCGRSYPVPWAAASIVPPAPIGIRQVEAVVDSGS
jgi:hypothetical protein